MMTREKQIESIDQLNAHISKQDIVLVFFDTSSWGVGRAVFPKLMDLANEYNLDVLRVDMDSQPLIKGQFTVFSAPTVLLFSNGREIIRESKFIDFERVDKTLNSLIR